MKSIKREVALMKKHKVFAWLTVFCFLACIITGYERK